MDQLLIISTILGGIAALWFFKDKIFSGWNQTPNSDPSLIKQTVELSREEIELIVEAAQDKSGTVIKSRFIGGSHVQTNGKQFIEGRNPRSRVLWEGAVDSLCNLGLLNERGHKGELFEVTSLGYEFADTINKSNT